MSVVFSTSALLPRGLLLGLATLVLAKNTWISSVTPLMRDVGTFCGGLAAILSLGLLFVREVREQWGHYKKPRD